MSDGVWFYNSIPLPDSDIQYYSIKFTMLLVVEIMSVADNTFLYIGK